PEFRETHEDALENHVRELNQNRERMLQCMDVKKLVEKIEAHAPARRTVNGQRHIEPLCRLINRIEVRMTVTFVQNGHCGHETGNEPKPLRALEFLGCFGGLVNR